MFSRQADWPDFLQIKTIKMVVNQGMHRMPFGISLELNTNQAVIHQYDDFGLALMIELNRNLSKKP